MITVSELLDRLRFRLGYDVRNLESVFPDPRERLAFLIGKSSGNRYWNPQGELFKIAYLHPELTDEAVIALAQFMYHCDGGQTKIDTGTGNLLLRLGPKAGAAIPYLKKILNVRPPKPSSPASSRNDHFPQDPSVAIRRMHDENDFYRETAKAIRCIQEQAKQIISVIEDSNHRDAKACD